jgi:hypothetical protein
MNYRRTSPQKRKKGKKSSSTNEILRTDITTRAQKTRVSSTHSKGGTNCHKRCRHAINKVSRNRRQPAPILKSEGIVFMRRLMKQRRAKHGISAEVRIKFAMMSSQCKTARKWETSTYARNTGVRANTCERHFNNKMTVWSHEVLPNQTPRTISRSS